MDDEGRERAFRAVSDTSFLGFGSLTLCVAETPVHRAQPVGSPVQGQQGYG